jgi:hypothetical protein
MIHNLRVDVVADRIFGVTQLSDLNEILIRTDMNVEVVDLQAA